jgi:Entner-Doudoroff aldolase
MDPVSFVDELRRHRATAILRTDDTARAAAAMRAAITGGFRIVEFTMSVPGALDLVREFSQRGDAIVGVGTVLTAEEAGRAVEAGARFIVSPVVDEVVIRAAAELGVAAMPGTQTPTEMLRAHRAGARLCKLFPAPAGGPEFVRAVLGPLPFLDIVPTNGVDETNAAEYIAAGAVAVGFLRSLFEPEAMQRGDWARIEQRARTLLAALAS